MTAVLLAYARHDRDLAGQVVRGLRAAGVEAWWDEDMPGITFSLALERQVGDLGALVVLWTPTSKNEPAVKDAARVALGSGKLINATSSGASPPFPYGSASGISLDGWNGAEDHPGWTNLVALIHARAKTTEGEDTPPAGFAPDPTHSTNADGAATPGAGSDTPKTVSGGESGPSSGGPAPHEPSDLTTSQQGRDTQQKLAEAINQWEQQNRETMPGLIVRRLLAVGVALLGFSIGLNMYQNITHPGAPWLIPVAILALAGFLWKGRR